MAPEALERILSAVPVQPFDERVIVGLSDNEDAAVVRIPQGKDLVQTLDFFTPIVNDPYRFGQIAAANALSDVFAMGGLPWCAMNIVCFPAGCYEDAVLRDILHGGADKAREAGAVIVGGHSVTDQELKYGLSVTGIIEPECGACNAGLRAGDQLILTKPLGTGILATGIKAALPNAEELEDVLYYWASRLNDAGGRVIRELKLRAATDVTGFGLGGHLLEMARASGAVVRLRQADVPVLAQALDLAAIGFVPAGTHANRTYNAQWTEITGALDPVRIDLIFDAQTSGGLLLAVPPKDVSSAMRMLEDAGECAALIGEVESVGGASARLYIS